MDSFSKFDATNIFHQPTHASDVFLEMLYPPFSSLAAFGQISIPPLLYTYPFRVVVVVEHPHGSYVISPCLFCSFQALRPHQGREFWDG